MSTTKFDGIEVCVFDAYGTLFDVHSAVGGLRTRLGNKADAVSQVWRTKQLEYTWLRSLMGRYVPFWEITGNALDFAFDANDVNDDALRVDLLNAYLSLTCYPEVPDVLRTLKKRGLKCAVLSNGSPDMLNAAVESAGLTKLLDAVLSVDGLQIFKPHPSVYQLALDEFDCNADQVSFQSSNAWDVSGAATFGFQVAWINRFGQAKERLPGEPGAMLSTLSELPDIVL